MFSADISQLLLLAFLEVRDSGESVGAQLSLQVTSFFTICAFCFATLSLLVRDCRGHTRLLRGHPFVDASR